MLHILKYMVHTCYTSWISG